MMQALTRHVHVAGTIESNDKSNDDIVVQFFIVFAS
jgi:hypothetical protein